MSTSSATIKQPPKIVLAAFLGAARVSLCCRTRLQMRLADRSRSQRIHRLPLLRRRNNKTRKLNC